MRCVYICPLLADAYAESGGDKMMVNNKWLAWGMLVLNLILIWLVATMRNMAAMWLMAAIMTLDAVMNLFVLYNKHQ